MSRPMMTLKRARELHGALRRQYLSGAPGVPKPPSFREFAQSARFGTGRAACACRDCFDIAPGGTGYGRNKSSLCDACFEAGCEPNSGECQHELRRQARAIVDAMNEGRVSP